MIAMLLMAQLSVAPSPADIMGARLPPNYVVPRDGEIIRQLKPTTPCGAAGRLEATYRTPAALYRRGDRPAKMYLGWRDYPDARGCLVEAKP